MVDVERSLSRSRSLPRQGQIPFKMIVNVSQESLQHFANERCIRPEETRRPFYESSRATRPRSSSVANKSAIRSRSS